MICNNINRCKIKACPHRLEHCELNQEDNHCDVPCDVLGGIQRSKCKTTTVNYE